MPAPTAQPRSQRSLLAVLVAVALVGGVGGCGDDGPTAAEAGATLAQDGRSLLSADAVLSNPAITQGADQDVPCGKGKARRIFAATARGPANSQFPVSVFDRQIMGELSSHGYGVDQGASKLDGERERLVVMTKKDPELTFQVTVRSAAPNYRIVGQTACLRTG